MNARERQRSARQVMCGGLAPIGPLLDVLNLGTVLEGPLCLPLNARDAGMRAVLLDRFGRENHGDELSAEGARWRAAGAAVVRDLSDVLASTSRGNDFALGCRPRHTRTSVQPRPEGETGIADAEGELPTSDVNTRLPLTHTPCLRNAHSKTSETFAPDWAGVSK